jgi:hypothetical protein
MIALWRVHHVSPNPQFLPWTVKNFKPYWSNTHQVWEFSDVPNAEMPQDVIDFCNQHRLSYAWFTQVRGTENAQSCVILKNAKTQREKTYIWAHNQICLGANAATGPSWARAQKDSQWLTNLSFHVVHSAHHALRLKHLFT